MNASIKPIICCGFTPCIQRILEFKAVEKESVNRASRVTIGIGGKGANTARMVTQLGGSPELVGFAGGANGRLLEELLTQERVRFEHVQTAGETRICQTLIEEGNPETTELVEEMPPITPREWKQMVALFGSLGLSGAVVAISGKLPAGAPVDAYAQVVKMVVEQGGRVILDAPGEPLLLALEHKPFVVKINDAELLQTVGGDDLPTACRELIKRGAQSVLITCGSRSAFICERAGNARNPPAKNRGGQSRRKRRCRDGWNGRRSESGQGGLRGSRHRHGLRRGQRAEPALRFP